VCVTKKIADIEHQRLRLARGPLCSLRDDVVVHVASAYLEVETQ
jgi:hypothetical protein